METNQLLRPEARRPRLQNRGAPPMGTQGPLDPWGHVACIEARVATWCGLRVKGLGLRV